MPALAACAARLLVAAALIAAPAAGEITCASAESMAGLMDAWTRDFTALHPATPARVVVHTKKSEAGLVAVMIKFGQMDKTKTPSPHHDGHAGEHAKEQAKEQIDEPPAN